MKEKCDSRTFKFTKDADQALVNLKEMTGRTMTLVLEDFLLGRRQFAEEIELWLAAECQHSGRKRQEIIENALRCAMQNKHDAG